jgi:hypothetical protein
METAGVGFGSPELAPVRVVETFIEIAQSPVLCGLVERWYQQ